MTIYTVKLLTLGSFHRAEIIRNGQCTMVEGDRDFLARAIGGIIVQDYAPAGNNLKDVVFPTPLGGFKRE